MQRDGARWFFLVVSWGFDDKPMMIPIKPMFVDLVSKYLKNHSWMYYKTND